MNRQTPQQKERHPAANQTEKGVSWCAEGRLKNPTLQNGPGKGCGAAACLRRHAPAGLPAQRDRAEKRRRRGKPLATRTHRQCHQPGATRRSPRTTGGGMRTSEYERDRRKQAPQGEQQKCRLPRSNSNTRHQVFVEKIRKLNERALKTNETPNDVSCW